MFSLRLPITRSVWLVFAAATAISLSGVPANEYHGVMLISRLIVVSIIACVGVIHLFLPSGSTPALNNASAPGAPPFNISPYAHQRRVGNKGISTSFRFADNPNFAICGYLSAGIMART